MPMKVTVCFDRVRVIVPCGDGELPVRDLINKAIVRYKKAIGKSNDHWVTVHNLKTSNDGGILDPDDLLNDVVDDREQLIADYDEQGGHVYQPHNGDGASASSAGTASPDIFSSSDTQNSSYPDNKDVHGYQIDNTHDIVVTPKDISLGSGLTVRHGSEPMLNILEGDTKITDKKPPYVKEKDEPKPIGIVHAKQASVDDEKANNPFSRLARDSWRQSLGNRPDMYKWLEAQERQQDKYRQMERREPLGGVSTDQNKENFPSKPVILKPAAGIPAEKNKDHVTSKPPLIKPPLFPAGTIPLVLTNDGGPLGIHVIPEYSEDEKELGLLVQGVEPGGRVYKDGRLQVNDRIVEINGTNLTGVSFARAQEIFRSAMKTNEIKLQVVKKKAPPLPKNPPPTMPKPKGHTPVKPSPLTLPSSKIENNGPISPMSPEHTSTPAGSVPSSSPEGSELRSPFSQKLEQDIQPIKGALPVQPDSPVKKTPPAPPVRNPATSLSTDPQQKAIIAPTNTKKIGKRITIELMKGSQGLGFSVTTRDNPAGGDTPIYIKNILPKGAAIADKRLKAGDRLLEVNGINMMNKTQSEAVAELRNCPQGSMVTIVVSRQEVVEERFKVPRELNSDKKNVLQPAEKSGDEDGSLATMKNKEIINLNVPLNDSGSAGLGVSVKGKTLTTEVGQKDLGIFIKAVIHGGAASKDGRLLINDQLVEVNGYTLTGLSNTDAMETLRKAMQLDGPTPGHIHLVIARRIGAPSPSPYQEYSTDYSLFSQSDDQQNSMENVQENAVDIQQQKNQDVMDGVVNTDDGASSNSKPKNYFLLDKLTGGGNGLRNDSYTRATHESFNDSANMFSFGLSPFGKPKVARDDSVIIEDDSEQKQQIRPHSTLGFGSRSPTHSLSSSSDDMDQQPPWLQGPDWNRHASTTSEELSPLPVDPFSRDAVGRQSMSEKRRGHLDPRGSEMYQKAKTIRDSQRGVSHRSASFHVTGQQGAQNLVRVGSAESLIGRPKSKPNARVPPLPVHGVVLPQKTSTPASNLKRFSSLENLAVTSHTSEQEGQNESQETEDEETETTNEDDAQNYPQFPMSRNRGCNESFRAAVDRSYDIADRPSMDTGSTYANGYEMEDDEDDDVDDDEYNPSLQSSTGFNYQPYGKILSQFLDLTQKQSQEEVEEESSESGSLAVSGPTNSARSSVSSEAPSEDVGKKGGRRKGKEKKGGIFKGIFRLGRNKKSAEEISAKSESEKLEEEAEKAMMNREEVTSRALQDQERLQEQYKRLQGDVYPGDPSRLPAYHLIDPHSHPSYHILEDRSRHTPIPGDTEGREHREQPPNITKAEWIQYLRAEHQRKHRERQGMYPLDDREELYERELQEVERRKYGQGAIIDNHVPYEQRPRPTSRQQYEPRLPQPHTTYIDYSAYSAPVPHHYPQNHASVPLLPRAHNLDYQHIRQNSDSHVDQSHDYYSRRPPSRSRTPVEHWQGDHMTYQQKLPYNRREVHPSEGYYGDPIFAYRDPPYPNMAGKRSVQTISQPGSAKV